VKDSGRGDLISRTARGEGMGRVRLVRIAGHSWRMAIHLMRQRAPKAAIAGQGPRLLGGISRRSALPYG
jgi:hypothetical protein